FRGAIRRIPVRPLLRKEGHDPMKRLHWLCLRLLVLATIVTVRSAAAQGLQPGVITGTINSSDGLSLPGATVAVTSPALPGTRTAVTDTNGNYVIPGLPPGN